MGASLQASLNERAQVTFNVAGFAAVYPGLASASWRMQIRPSAGGPLYFDFAVSGLATYIASPVPSIMFQAPTSALTAIPTSIADYEYGFVLPGCDYEIADSGSIIFSKGIVQAGVSGAPAPPSGSDDTWIGGVNPTPSPVPPTLTSAIALASQSAAASSASAAAAASSATAAAALGLPPVYFYKTAAAVTAATIPTVAAGGPVNLKTLGYFVAGDYGGATYTRVASGGQLTSADGQSWQIADLEPYCNAFGTFGDNVHDDTAAIQACLDFVINNQRYKARLAPGTYKTSDTIHVGYGWGPTSGRFCTICLEGETGINAGAFGTTNPTTIAATFQDRPIINIQGVQRGGVRHLSITGPGTMAGVTSFGNFTGWSVLEFANPANYIPAVSGTPANTFQNTPFCGVCIDAYYTAGAGAPANPYPSPVYPSWIKQSDLPAAAPYGVFQSTDCFVTDCTFNNCLIGIVDQPYGVGNGDFMKFHHNEYNGCFIGVCIGGSQARVTNYDESKFAGCYTCIDGGVSSCTGTIGSGGSFGSGDGNVSGSMKNMHGNYCFQLLATNGGWQKGINVDGFYSEVMTRVGMNIGSPTNISFNDCYFTCDNYFGTTQVFMMPIYEGAGAASSQYIKFNRCKFEGIWGAAQFNSICKFDGCAFTLLSGPGAGYSTTFALESTAYQRMTNILTNKFFSDPTFNAFQTCNSNGSAYSGYDTGISGGSQYWHSVGCSAFSPLNYLIPGHYAFSTALNLTSFTWTGRTFTGTIAVPYCQIGDVLLITTLGWCVLTGVSGTTISGTMISHFQYSSGTFNVVTVDSFGNYTAQSDAFMNANFATGMEGCYFPINIFDYVPSTNAHFWQTVAGSPTVTFGTGTEAAFTPSAVPAGITTASKVLWTNAGNAIQIGIPFPGGTTAVSAVGTNTLTMTSNASISGYWSATPGIYRVA